MTVLQSLALHNNDEPRHSANKVIPSFLCHVTQLPVCCGVADPHKSRPCGETDSSKSRRSIHVVKTQARSEPRMCAACLCHQRASSGHFARTCRQTSRTHTHKEQSSRSLSSSFNSRSYELFVNPVNLCSPYLGNKAVRLFGLSAASSSSHFLSFIDRRLTAFACTLVSWF